MPYADPDKQREAMKLIMRKRRAKTKRRKKNLDILRQGVDEEDGKEKQT